MEALFIHMGLSFLEGLALIISPCILPVIPIILSGSLTGNKSKPYGIIVGFLTAFTTLTLASQALIQFTQINPDTLRNVSYVLLIMLAIIMLSSTLTEKFSLLTQRLTRVGQTTSQSEIGRGGFFSGIIFGGLVGIIWIPCAGPILAAALIQAILQKTTMNSFLVVMAFALGVGIPMLFIAVLGRKIIDRFHFIREHTNLFRKLLGLIILSCVFILLYETNVVYSVKQINNVKTGMSLINGVEEPYAAPKIAGIDAWINSPPLNLAKLKGKVVLIDFWTYSCINCIRTLGYSTDWYNKYRQDGLVIIGIHSPEFSFERELKNVKDAVKKFGVNYPVALDNNFETWQNFENKYWPALYLINKEGFVVYEHFGEGQYDVTENNIRYLLGLNKKEMIYHSEQTYSAAQTPETYLGLARIENFASPEKIVKDVATNYTYPNTLEINQWAVRGKWTFTNEKIIAVSENATLKLHFNASRVYAVMGVQHKPTEITINLLQPDLLNKIKEKKSITKYQLYRLIDLEKEMDATIEITVNPGVEIYTFTFGAATS